MCHEPSSSPPFAKEGAEGCIRFGCRLGLYAQAPWPPVKEGSDSNGEKQRSSSELMFSKTPKLVCEHQTNGPKHWLYRSLFLLRFGRRFLRQLLDQLLEVVPARMGSRSGSFAMCWHHCSRPSRPFAAGPSPGRRTRSSCLRSWRWRANRRRRSCTTGRRSSSGFLVSSATSATASATFPA